MSDDTNNDNLTGGLLSRFANMFSNFSPSNSGTSMPMDIRPQVLQDTMQQQQGGGFNYGNSFNAMGDAGMRLMFAGQNQTPQARLQILGSIPGALSHYNYQSQPFGLLGGAPTQTANNQVWANLGGGLNANGSPNTNAGFGSHAQQFTQPAPIGASPYGLY